MRESPKRVEQILYHISDIGRLVGEVLLGGIVSLMVADIILRYIFNRPLAYSKEMVELTLVLVVFFGIAICTAQRGHVKMDIFLMRFPQRVQAVINSFIYILATGLFSLITWRSFVYVMQIRDRGQESAILGVPIYPFVFMVALWSLLITLLFLSQLIHFVVEASRKWT